MENFIITDYYIYCVNKQDLPKQTIFFFQKGGNATTATSYKKNSSTSFIYIKPFLNTC
jgi:hypothetical protein